MALAGTPLSGDTIVPAREVCVSATTRHQLVAVTSLLGATGRKYGPDAGTIPAGKDVLPRNVPGYVCPLINDPRELPVAELREDNAGFVDRMPAVREVR